MSKNILFLIVDEGLDGFCKIVNYIYGKLENTMHIFITGASSGLGKELAETFLEKSNKNVVTGISRSKTIEHPRYHHIYADLSNIDELERLEIIISESENRCMLINNAGQIEPIGFIHNLSPNNLAKHYHLNVLAAHVMCAKFLMSTENKPHRHIINISSGAGKYPVEGWSAYCAGKAAIDMLSRVMAEEYANLDVWSLAPGIVDTPMQSTIRNTPQESFPDLPRFVNYHRNGELVSAKQTALKIIALIDHPEKVKEVVISLRDFA